MSDLKLFQIWISWNNCLQCASIHYFIRAVCSSINWFRLNIYYLCVCVCAVERNEIAIEFRAILNTNRISNYTLRKQTIPIYGPSYICAKIEERGKYCCVNSGGFSGRLGAVRSVCAPLHTINMIFELSGTSRNWICASFGGPCIQKVKKKNDNNNRQPNTIYANNALVHRHSFDCTFIGFGTSDMHCQRRAKQFSYYEIGRVDLDDSYKHTDFCECHCSVVCWIWASAQSHLVFALFSMLLIPCRYLIPWLLIL